MAEKAKAESQEARRLVRQHVVEYGCAGNQSEKLIITPAKMEALTAREIEVLELICQGCSTKEIAYRLGIAFKTAGSHRSHLFEKAGVDNAVRLFRWALEEGYVTVNRKPSATQR
jgi:DNA-binding NarL/FixJ family response regulator